MPVESIAEDLLGLRIERSAEIDCSGMLVPAERRIVLNAAEAPRDHPPLRRYRFTIAHELGHWVCHVLGAATAQPVYCRAVDLTEAADRSLEREANVFAAELLMPEPAVRAAWVGPATGRHEEDAIAACAERFDVSPTAMRWRLHSFDRNTREILELASEFLLNGGSLRADETPDVEDENAVIPPEAALRTGARPTLTLSSNGDRVDEAVSMAKSMLGVRAGPKNVAILYLGGREGWELDHALRAAGVEYFWVNDPRSADNKNRIAEATAPVILSTVHSAKGMEFPGVVLSCTPRADDQDSDELRRTIYVGMTRATERLAVFADAGHPLAADLEKAAAVTGRLRVDRVDNDSSVQDEAACATRVAKRPGRRQSAAQADIV